MSQNRDRKKIAILGGGISSLTTAFELTAQSDWQDRYEITIYQMGWRLGGKGASSRNSEANNRIEEHGLHIWLGFYENAFNVIRRCYEELGREPDTPLATWSNAFKPHNFLVLEEHIGDTWIHWPCTFPTNDSLPGEGRDLPTLWDYLIMGLQWIEESFSDYSTTGSLPNELDHIPHAPDWLLFVLKTCVTEVECVGRNLGAILLRAALRKAQNLPKDPSIHGAADHQIILWLLQAFSQWFASALDGLLERDTDLRRIWIPIDTVAATVRGLLADGVMFNGLDALDAYEFRQWLSKHGASELALDSPWIRAAYDLAFSFEGGDITKPNVAAGVAIRGLLRMVFTYKGAILWKMQAGMGETVFTPLYHVLKRRGVKFKFFHRVTNLGLSPDRSTIATLSFTRQVTLKVDEYEPLIEVNGIACWPHKPLHDQIVEADQLIAGQINLESFWTPWPGVEDLTLRVGDDFDLIVFGIPVSALAGICPELLNAKPDWRAMIEGVKTIQTQGFQVWLNRDLAEMGWQYQSPVLGAYVEPFDTWADMTHLLAHESWPVETTPRQLAYVCGVMPDAEMIPPSTDHNFPQIESERTREAAIDFLERHAGYLWPAAVDPASALLDWSVLVAPDGVNGRDRFDAQYWRPNIDPSERYVLAVAGSTQFRLRTDKSGFTNLVLTGDWIKNGLNMPGCIEGAVISGRQASRAISGRPTTIIGESDFPV